MVDQREALAVTTDLLTRFIWFALPGFEPSTLVETLGAEPLARWVSFARQGSLSTQITRPRGYPERYLEPSNK